MGTNVGLVVGGDCTGFAVYKRTRETTTRITASAAYAQSFAMFWRTLASPQASLPTLPPSRRWRNGLSWRSKTTSQKLHVVEDAKKILVEKANNTEETSLSDDDDDDDGVLDVTEDHESGADEDEKAPPVFAELSALFRPLEELRRVEWHLRGRAFSPQKTKLAFFAAHAAKPARQSDIRAFTQS